MQAGENCGAGAVWHWSISGSNACTMQRSVEDPVCPQRMQKTQRIQNKGPNTFI
jgi:hypothetical protein